MYVHVIIIHINDRVLCVELNTLILRQGIMCGTQYFNFTTGYCVWNSILNFTTCICILCVELNTYFYDMYVHVITIII